MAQDRYEKRNFTVVGVFGLVLCLFFVSGAWADCREYTGDVRWDGSGYYFSPQVQGCAFQDMGNTACGFHAQMLGSGGLVCRVVNEGSCYRGYVSEGVVISVCQNQCQSDSVLCINDGGLWQPDSTAECGKSCRHCDDKCQCEEEGGTWMPQGYCLPNCQTRGCCDSLNWRLPTTYDTAWNGCVSPDGTNSCTEKHSVSLLYTRSRICLSQFS